MNRFFLNTILISYLLLINCSPSIGQIDLKIPKVIQANFKQHYPKVTDVIWEQDTLEFTAFFDQGDYPIEITFINNNLGEWLQTVTSLDLEDLPIAAQTYVKKNYKTRRFDSISKVEIPDFVHYFANFDTATNMVSLTFDTQGKLLETEIYEL